MDTHHQRGFAAQPLAMPEPTATSNTTSLLTASLQQYSLLSHALRRESSVVEEPTHEDDPLGRRRSVAMGCVARPVMTSTGRSPPPTTQVIPKPILRKPTSSDVPSTAVSVSTLTSHPPISPLLRSEGIDSSTDDDPVPPLLMRKTSLKFAIAPTGAPHPGMIPGSRRGSLDVVPGGEEDDVIGDILEDEEDEDGQNDDEEIEDEEDEDYQDDSNGSNEDDSNEDNSNGEDSNESEEQRYSGYEEDSETGFSDDEEVEQIVKESQIISPVRRRTGTGSPLLAGLRDFVVGACAREGEGDVFDARTGPATHFSSIPSPTAHPSFAFARPTNYRRRRPASIISADGIVGGSASSLITPGPGSFVKIDPQERLHRGRGAVQILDPIPQGGERPQQDTLTRHCSPPPAHRSRSSSRSAVHPSASAASIARPPRPDLSPSAIRMQVRRGYSDSPRKRKARADAVVRQMNLFGAGRAAMTTDDDVRSRNDSRVMVGPARVDTTEDEVLVRRELQATRGWRSDDALFAVPMVRRYPSAAAHPIGGGSRKSSIATAPVPSSATASDLEHGQPMDRSVSHGTRPISRRPSEKAHATMNGLLSPTEPTIGYFTASAAPCPPAVDDTPALASGASVLPSTPVDQLLHEKLAGTPSRRRGSDAVAHGKAESGSDGYRSRASSAMGFRSDDAHGYQHPRESATTYQASHTPQQHHTTIMETQDALEGLHVAPHTPRVDAAQRLPSAGILLSPSGPQGKSKPIKCPSPRRRQEHEVRI